jgi:hypothetical protein
VQYEDVPVARADVAAPRLRKKMLKSALNSLNDFPCNLHA